MIVLSVFFVVVGFAFKISAVPFHFWAPDTYEGAPSPVAAFLSTASKIGGFVGLLVLMFRAFPEVADNWRPAMAVLAVLTMTVANLIALRQQHIIRLLAYSGIAQSGYVLVTLALIDAGTGQAAVDANEAAFSAAVIYLVIYAVMDLGAFAAAVALRAPGRDLLHLGLQRVVAAFARARHPARRFLAVSGGGSTDGRGVGEAVRVPRHG